MSQSDRGKASRRRRQRRDEVVPLTQPGEPAPERRLRCNHSKLRLRVRRPPALRHPYLPDDV